MTTETFNKAKSTSPPPITNRVFVLIYAKDTDKFLAFHRKSDRTWGLPGGYIELNQQESPKDAICRETNEEIGVQLLDPTEICTFDVENNKNCKIYLEIIETEQDLNINLCPTEALETRWAQLDNWPAPQHPKMSMVITGVKQAINRQKQTIPQTTPKLVIRNANEDCSFAT
ncbi:MAG: NUDIX hydrolase [Alphaproteobacteria bacterium]|nr:NUDIX hydrolase [Alphaproteobacteria bacterium]MCB9985075.1 NUDIX hydrolase [Micavibrio sp.]